jgi:hypothetical protein
VRRIKRLLPSEAAQAFLRERQSSVGKLGTISKANVQQAWKSARQSAAMTDVLRTLQSMILETSVDRSQLLGTPRGYWVLALFQRSPVW